MRTQKILLLVAALWMVTLAPSLEAAESRGCLSLLARSRVAVQKGGGQAAIRQYEAALDACARQHLPALQEAVVLEHRGYFLRDYGQDPDGALDAYALGLALVEKEDGLDSPRRIPLLDGFARTLQQATDPVDRDRVLFLLEESLRLRDLGYGGESMQVAEGRLALAMAHLPQEPEVAEKLILAAKASATRADRLDVVGDSYSALQTLYQMSARPEAAHQAGEEASYYYGQVPEE